MWKPLHRLPGQAAETLIARTGVYPAVAEVRAAAEAHSDAMDRIAHAFELLVVGALAFLVWTMWPDD